MRIVPTNKWAWIAAGGLVSLLVVFVQPLLIRSDARLARHFTQRIAQLSDAPAANLTRHFKPESAEAIRGLVALAASPREAVAQAAQTQLKNWVVALEEPRERGVTRLLNGTRSALTLALAESLAERSPQFGPLGLQWAKYLVQRLIEVPHLVKPSQRLELLRYCETVLSSRPRHLVLSGRSIGLEPKVLENLAAADRIPMPAAAGRILQIAMQVEPQPHSRPPSALDGTSPAEVSRESTGAMAATGESPPSFGPQEDQVRTLPEPHLSNLAGTGLQWRSTSDQAFARIAPQSRGPADPMDVPSPDVAQTREREFLNAPLREVIAKLATRDQFERASAEAALRERGMSDVDIQIARRLDGADEKSRQQLLEAVLQTRGVHLVHWLRYFATDESDEIRARAITILATSRQASLVHDVYQLVLRDKSPRIRALADMLRSRIESAP